MKEKPILLNSEMVRATLDDRKTQTRRPFKIQPCSSWKLAKVLADGRAVFDVAHGNIQAADVAFVKSPFGAPGDLLWVRETWGVGASFGGIKPRDMLAAMKPGYSPKVTYRADCSAEFDADFYRWRPSIHMPRWASRLTLRVKKVGVERVQNIDATGALLEGTPGAWIEQDGYPGRLVENPNVAHVHFFSLLWDRIYAKRGFPWNSNCWVWVCEFEVTK